MEESPWPPGLTIPLNNICLSDIRRGRYNHNTRYKNGETQRERGRSGGSKCLNDVQQGQGTQHNVRPRDPGRFLLLGSASLISYIFSYL